MKAESIADIVETSASNGGTHFRVLDDFGHTTVETEYSASTQTGAVGLLLGTTPGHASSRLEKHHRYTAEVYRCR